MSEKKLKKRILIELFFLIGWTIIMLFSFFSNFINLEKEILKLAETEAEISYKKDIFYRRWNANHGGVYAPISESSPPNDYLAVPERDIITDDGKKLTLINPAYMTRQVYELVEEDIGIIGHMTSLQPINPVNKPDAFEKTGLTLFELGYDQFHTIEQKGDKQFFRLLKPFVTEKSCMKCHEHQGYKVGDVRGGISVIVPLTHFNAFYDSQSNGMIWGHIIIWIIGIAGIHLGFVLIRKNQYELSRSREQWVHLFRKTIDPIFIFNENGLILESNDAFVNLTGLNPDDLKNKKINTLSDNHHFRNLDKFDSLDLKEKITFSDKINCKDGKRIDAEFHIGKIIVNDNPVFLVIAIDIRDRKKYENQLIASENRYRSLFENDYDAVFILDKLTVYDCNPEATKLFGISKEKLIGNSPFNYAPESQPNGKNSPEFAKEMIEKTIKEGRQIFEFEHLSDSNKTFFTQVFTIPVSVDGKDFIQARLHDITIRKKAMVEKEQLHQELLSKNEELEQIVYITSHDLRSPLVNIQGFSSEIRISVGEIKQKIHDSENIDENTKHELISMLEEDVLDSLNFIDTSTLKMDSLLSGLLKISRLGRTKINKTNINMNMLLTEVVSLHEFTIKEKGASIFIDELAECYSDEEQLNQVFSNLIGNALKYAEPGKKPMVKVSSRIENDKIIYSVKDNGIGIDEKNHKKIFDIFQRVDNSFSDGEGLGLTIIKKIISRLDGEISVSSEPKKGSIFSVILPYKEQFDDLIEF